MNIRLGVADFLMQGNINEKAEIDQGGLLDGGNTRF